jgi:hypothetical protein
LIPKENDTTPAEVAQTRPIALNPAIAKVCKTVIARRLQAAIHDAIAANQHGFLKDNSASNCVSKLLQLWKDHKNFVTVFLDVSKAYDKLEHSAIIAALRRFNLGDDFCTLIQRYLSAARTRFHADDACSDWVFLKRGVLQGCPISPLLYILATDHLFTPESHSHDLGFADDLCATGRLTNVSHTLNRMIPALAAAGLAINASKSAFIGLEGQRSIRIDQTTVFDRGKEVVYLGYPVTRNARQRRQLLFERILKCCLACVPTLYSLSYTQAVSFINQRLAPRIAYLARIDHLTKTQLKQIDAPIVRVLMRHPGKYHCGSVSKGALFAVLRVQFPSTVVMRSRMYQLNSSPDTPCPYKTEMAIQLPLSRPALKAAMNAYFYRCYTARWTASSSGELLRACPPLLQELRRLPDKRKPFALAFITNTLPTAHSMYRIRLHQDPQCSCGRGACTSRHLLKWHAGMPLNRIHWKRLMQVTRPLLLRLPK